MKASELIEALQALVAEHGDVEVCLMSQGDTCEISVVEMRPDWGITELVIY